MIFQTRQEHNAAVDIALARASKLHAYERRMAALEPKGDNSDDVVISTDPNYLER